MPTSKHSHHFSVAPMIDWTDRHARYFMRLISRHTLLYTEMITTGAILQGDAERFLAFNDEEHPLVLQLGGADPQALADACNVADGFGYDEYNLNVGCPSDRVQSGRFGACLMAEPALVRDCISAMRASTDKPVSVKSRTGIDDLDSYAFLQDFIGTVSESGCDTFIIHARKAWLSGLSPKENREIPPLHYDRVYQIKADFPDLNIIINGGIQSLSACVEHLQHIDGVMVGREAYNNPYFMAQVDQQLFDDDTPVPSRHEVVGLMLPYIEEQLMQGHRLNHISRHMLGIFNGQQGAKIFRRYISENAHKPGAGPEVIEHALAAMAPVKTEENS